MGAFGIAEPGNPVVTGVKHEILELVALVHKDMVNAHLLEIHDAVLVLLHLILDSRYLGCQVFLALDEPFQHTARYVMPLLLDNFEIFLHCIKLSLQNLLLHFRRLGYLAELVVRHDDTVIVVVLDLVEKGHSVLCLETLFIGIEDSRIWICGLICHRNFSDIRLQADNHRLVGESETPHLMRRNAHYQRLAAPYLKIANTASVLFKHPDTIFLRGIQ